MSTAPVSVVQHRGWERPLSRPAMANHEDPHHRIGLTDRYLERDGAPFIPVTGEMHYSRVPRAQWEHRLRVLRASGLTTVSTYLIWIHHEEIQGEVSFDGNLDVRAFVDLAAAVGLDVIVRIGPWCHGEVRNGGLPDWVQHFGGQVRSNDPRYLELVRPWYRAIAGQLADLCGPDSPIVGIQIDNELYHRPEHLSELKRLARENGLSAPIWTATGWGHARLPERELLPVFGGYGDGHWVDITTAWDDTFRQHYFFSHVWDDPGIGGDLRFGAELEGEVSTSRTASPDLPAATCEIGGGTMNAYHRRTAMSGLDVAAVPHAKLGNGSSWQGYYMYAGGRNPTGLVTTLQESHATNYASELPVFDYDFAAPVTAAGETGSSLPALRRQHAFLAAFGPALATMPSSLPEVRPATLDDDSTLRWALRSDGTSGWVFVNWHQPHLPLPPCAGVQLQVQLDDETLTLPSAPVTIPAGTLAHWPLNLEVGGVRVRWATASALTVLTQLDTPTLVLVAEAGVPVEIAVDAATQTSGLTEMPHPDPSLRVGSVAADERRVVDLRAGSGALRVLVLPSTDAELLWVLDGARGRRLLLADGAVWVREDGVVETDGSRLAEVDGTGVLRDLLADHERLPRTAHASVELVREPGEPLPSYGERAGRASAPAAEVFDKLAATYAVELPAWAFERPDETLVDITWEGDVAALNGGGRAITDRFWDGRVWTERVSQLGLDGATSLLLRLLPLHPHAPIRFPAGVAEHRTEPLCRVVSVVVREQPRRTEQ